MEPSRIALECHTDKKQLQEKGGIDGYDQEYLASRMRGTKSTKIDIGSAIIRKAENGYQSGACNKTSSLDIKEQLKMNKSAKFTARNQKKMQQRRQ